MKIIGVGVGRTGTYSLKLAINQLGFGPCHHMETVLSNQTAIPAEQFLVYQVKDGWGPLCDFLSVPAPTEPFPRSNDRSEFWDLVAPALRSS